jgi:hypothetical protein
MAMERKSGDPMSAAYQWAEGGGLGDELAGTGAVDAPAVYTPWSRPLARGGAGRRRPRSYQATTLRPSTVLPCGAPGSRLHTGRKALVQPVEPLLPGRRRRQRVLGPCVSAATADTDSGGLPSAAPRLAPRRRGGGGGGRRARGAGVGREEGGARRGCEGRALARRAMEPSRGNVVGGGYAQIGRRAVFVSETTILGWPSQKEKFFAA